MAYTLRQTDAFADWFSRLRDRTVKLRLLARLARAENGNFGDVKTVDGALKEFRMPFGGGVRIYHVIRDNQIILLINGGNKATQARDIERAKRLLAEELSNE
jgi:putative addiction module killer protein